MKTRAIHIEKYGGPEVMGFIDAVIPEPAVGEARVRHTAIGLNFIDVYHRAGLYPIDLPGGLGSEAAGIVDAIGEGLSGLKPGDRVVYTGPPLGAYADGRNYPAAKLVPIPDDIDDEVAAAAFLKGLTAWYLLHHSYPVQSGDSILFYAVAGGVGSIACQWAKALGVTVIGVVGTDEKAAKAASKGCDHVFRSDSDIVSAVRKLTDGKGVAAVYDSIGKDTFLTSLDCLRPHGVMVSFGNSSGSVDPFSPAELAKRHSLYVTRPVLFDFVDTRKRLLSASTELFGRIQNGDIAIDIGQRYALDDVAQAHRDLEARKTTGSTVLLP